MSEPIVTPQLALVKSLPAVVCSNGANPEKGMGSPFGNSVVYKSAHLTSALLEGARLVEGVRNVHNGEQVDKYPHPFANLEFFLFCHSALQSRKYLGIPDHGNTPCVHKC